MAVSGLTAARELRLSELAPRTLQSEIRAMTMECDRIGGVNLAQGVCDTEPPAEVLAGAIDAIQAGHNIYTRLDGIARLREAIAAKMLRDRGLVVDPDREVLVTSGATGGLNAAAAALLNPGDEVILFEPFYGYHASELKSKRMVPVVVPLTAPETADADWTLDMDAVRAAVTDKTRAMIVNTPSNPAGKIFTRAELAALAELAVERGLFVFTDEIYEHFVYGDAEHVSMAALPGMRERTIVISGFSKTFSVTGWRLGYLVADAKWLGAISYFHDLTYVCAPSAFQHGAAAGLEKLGPEFYEALATDHLLKRAKIVAALNGAGMKAYVPRGAYYVLADASRLPGETAAKKARWLLAETGVASVAGSAFFRAGGGGDGFRSRASQHGRAGAEESLSKRRTSLDKRNGRPELRVRPFLPFQFRFYSPCRRAWPEIHVEMRSFVCSS
jgi:aminotransferase